MLILLVLVVAAVIAVGFLVFQRSRPVAMAATPDPAEMILSERLARGEIDEEEYRRRLAALRERLRS
jgi:putative membrane protein